MQGPETGRLDVSKLAEFSTSHDDCPTPNLQFATPAIGEPPTKTTPDTPASPGDTMVPLFQGFSDTQRPCSNHRDGNHDVESPVLGRFAGATTAGCSPFVSSDLEDVVENPFVSSFPDLLDIENPYLPQFPGLLDVDTVREPTQHIRRRSLLSIMSAIASGSYHPEATQVGTTAATQSLTREVVEDLRRLFQVVYDEWQLRLSKSSDPIVKFPDPHIHRVFEKGLNTLWLFMQGELPSTLESTFALMQLASACLYRQSDTHDISSWNNIFQDMLGWRHSIKNQAERTSFLHMMVQVMGRHHSWIDLCQPACIERKPVVMASRTGDPIRTSQKGHLQKDEFKYTDAPTTHRFGPLWSKLEQGRVVSACSEFLDSKSKLSMLRQYIC